MERLNRSNPQITPEQFENFLTSPLEDSGVPHLYPEPGIFFEPYREQLLQMSESEMMDFISGPLLEKENILYQFGNTIEHKLIFLVHSNVSAARTVDGNPAVSKPKPYPKHSELFEFREAVRTHLSGHEDIAHTLSETADIFHNLILAAKLQDEFIEQESEVLKPSLVLGSGEGYLRKMHQFRQIIGLSRIDALRMAVLKYHFRLLVNGGEKNEDMEDLLVGSLLFHPDKKIQHIPNQIELNRAYDFTWGKLRPFLESSLANVRSKIQSRQRVQELMVMSG